MVSEGRAQNQIETGPHKQRCRRGVLRHKDMSGSRFRRSSPVASAGHHMCSGAFAFLPPHLARFLSRRHDAGRTHHIFCRFTAQDYHTNLAETDFTQTQQEQTPKVHKSPLAEQSLLQRCLPTIPSRPPWKLCVQSGPRRIRDDTHG